MKGYFALSSLIALGAALPIDLAEKRSNAVESVVDNVDNVGSTAVAGLNVVGADINSALDAAGKADVSGAVDNAVQAISDFISGTSDVAGSAASGASAIAGGASTKRSQIDDLLAKLTAIITSNKKRSTESTATTIGSGAGDVVGTAYDGVNVVAGDLNDAISAAESGDAVSAIGNVAEGVVDLGSGIVSTAASAIDGIADTAAAAVSGKKRAIEAAKALI